MSIDPDTFLTGLYVLIDTWCKAQPPARVRPGPAPALARSEVVTLGVFGQWARFASERDFYRYADQRLRAAFPRLPDRSQFNRQLRAEWKTVVELGHHLAAQVDAHQATYEVIDGTGVAVRNSKRRGGGWLPEYAGLGRCSRLGWYEGFHLLVAATPEGVITGYGFGSAEAKDQPLAETFFAARHTGDPRLPTVGVPAGEPYLADSGFIGADRHAHWRAAFGSTVICPPYRSAVRNWPKPLRRWLSGLRQIIESVNAKLLHTFRLEHERPHTLDGFHVRLAAKAALHNYCCWLNRHLGRHTLAFADLLGW